MDAALQQAIAAKLAGLGLIVTRDVREGGSVVGSEPVRPAELVAAWTRLGWRVRLDGEDARDAGRATPDRILRLVRPDLVS